MRTPPVQTLRTGDNEGLEGGQKSKPKAKAQAPSGSDKVSPPNAFEAVVAAPEEEGPIPLEFLDLSRKIRAHPRFEALSSNEKKLVRSILGHALRYENSVYYAQKLLAALNVQERKPKSIAVDRLERMEEALNEVKPRSEALQQREEEVAALPHRQWTSLKGVNPKVTLGKKEFKGTGKYRADIQDPTSIVVQAKVALLGHSGCRFISGTLVKSIT